MKSFATLVYALLVTFFVTPFTFLGQTSCPNPYDGNSDGAVTINDLLDLLGVFGDTDTDGDGIWDSVDNCIDVSACNFDSNPSVTCSYIDVLGICGGGCAGDSDGDGICDDVDTCVGILDECGVCNGPGPTNIIIESITTVYDSVYVFDIDFWFVYETGVDTVMSYVCDPVFAACGDLVAHDGYDYSTVQIGDQCWFSENCRYLPSVSPSSSSSNTTPYYYVYAYNGTDVVAAQATSNYLTYGVLYNWPAVMEPGICPSGWHIPTDLDWQTMEMSLGMSAADATSTGWRGTDQGSQMKSASGWLNNGNGTNSSGFTGLPSGYAYSGGFNYVGNYGYWWSSSASGSSAAWYRVLNYFNVNVFRGNDYSDFGFSARCVMD
ncbi:MAG: hypothetical protein COA49_05485 [Bacteroidetes bacterium]|nr:MAG: hypothetical protein COA49_05485 [Bacteroidota bacterium]